MLMLLDIAITGGVNLRPNFSPGVYFRLIIINYGKIESSRCGKRAWRASKEDKGSA